MGGPIVKSALLSFEKKQGVRRRGGLSALTCTTNKVVIQLASSNVSLQFCVIL